MEKYLVIILVILLVYTIYQCWKLATVTTEGFADASVPANVDTNNSIATLAQLATDLQAGGGLKVPGTLNVQGNANIGGMSFTPGTASPDSGNINFTGDGSGWGLNFNTSSRKRVARFGDNGSFTTAGTIHAHTDGFHTRLGVVWTAPGVYAEDGKNLELGAGSSNVYIGAANGNGNNNLIVTGGLNASGRDILVELNKLRADLDKSRKDLDDRTKYIVRFGDMGALPDYDAQPEGKSIRDGNGKVNGHITTWRRKGV